MAWIESHQELKDHPKTRKLMRLLELGPPAVIGHLHLLWWWALDYAEQGDLSGYENWEIADAAMWEGDPNAFVHALLNCGKPGEAGFLREGDNHSLHIHDWDEYAGRLLDQREKNAAKQRAWREKQRNGYVTDEPISNKEVRNGYVTVTSSSRDGATVPNRTVPNQTVESTQPAKRTTDIHPIPPDFSITPAMRQWAKDEKISALINLDSHTRNFVEYWTEGEGQGRGKKNWLLAWKKWMRTEAERAEARGGNGKARGEVPPPDLQGSVPPRGYSWERNNAGDWKPHEWSAETQSYPYGCETMQEALDITAQRREEHIRRREMGKRSSAA